MKNKKIKKLIFVLLIILLVLIITLVIAKNMQKSNDEKPHKYTEEDIEILETSLKNYYSDKITPEGMGSLYGQYRGMNELNDLYRKLYLLVNYLPNISKVAYENDKDIIVYYNNNSKDIKNNLGISSLEEFIDFINYLKKVNYKGEKYVSSTIEEDTYIEKKGYLTFDLSFIFENFDKEFKLKVHFANSSMVDPIVFYTLVEEDTTENITEEINNTVQENTIVVNDDTNTVN